MPLPLMIHPTLALFAQRTRIPTSARSIGFCVIWVCISSSSSSEPELAFWGKFACVKAVHVLFWCLCDYCELVFLCYWESIN